MKPLIGLTCSSEKGRAWLSQAYIRAVTEAGGEAALVVPGSAADWSRRLDGLLLTGGGDIAPWRYGEEPVSVSGLDEARDAFEIELLLEMHRLEKPVLGICRGIQVIQAAFGGRLYQDLYLMFPPARNHGYSSKPRPPEVLAHASDYPGDHWHPVLIRKASLMDKLFDAAPNWTNSMHHQSLRGFVPPFLPTVFSPDGVVEAIESPKIVGVQWHPERMLWHPASRRLFTIFVEAARYGRDIILDP
ncbi:gamma-glutamyl-gamma-aminobutyrate hydrolase family protein [Gehongia tenuis]|uniref:Gamma-glutamyl-gamma-aminobutyrate hydrolase family protein n=1 Tax=Gehongia tenuis TaxID=2763655 RepID=A0A926HQC6_9FIRM|nr:gamma-glutamyl-gamma-aminobutyrate hydrolase family protein [Gehongia tenuis]MBC8532083.1 gamma-glutamyl-gamma-aminobutyrate hydrolase family protein [Gehongia tenuis]